ncbi:hypothetical protein Anas_10844 [Armadillidium nasatum]|uniref:Uncharacterized protein n=1 Tax=Armadillidium nasatum TaxID=96803 RepID=A0A5N5TCX4_9CRUS|nr:hypothetical protein Anas_10844 [Armadillidium nasatum]
MKITLTKLMNKLNWLPKYCSDSISTVIFTCILIALATKASKNFPLNIFSKIQKKSNRKEYYNFKKNFRTLSTCCVSCNKTACIDLKGNDCLYGIGLGLCNCCEECLLGPGEVCDVIHHRFMVLAEKD